MRAVITVTGKDRTGIIAKISNTLYEQQVNIIDISQNVMEDVFAMVMLVNIDKCTVDFNTLIDLLDKDGEELGMKIHTMLQLSVEVGHVAEFYAADDLGAGGEQHTDVKPLGHALVNARRALRAAGLGLRAVGDIAHLADIRQKRADGITVVWIARLLGTADEIADLERLTSVIVLKAGDRDENVLVFCHAKHSFLL